MCIRDRGSYHAYQKNRSGDIMTVIDVIAGMTLSLIHIFAIGSYMPEMREIPDAVLDLVDNVYIELPYACLLYTSRCV